MINIKIPIYGQSFSLCETEEEWQELFPEDDPLYAGRVCYSDRAIVVYVKGTPSAMNPEYMSSLVHELAHVAHIVLGFVGVPVTTEEDEAFCYLLAFLVEEVYKKVLL